MHEETYKSGCLKELQPILKSDILQPIQCTLRAGLLEEWWKRTELIYLFLTFIF